MLLAILAATACQERRVDPPLPGTSAAVASGGPAATAPTAAAAPGRTGDRCDAAIRHVSALLGETTGIEEDAGRCRTEAWPPEFVACMTTTPDIPTYASRCMKLLFSDADGLRVGRVFEPGASRAGDPPAGEQDGDLVLWDADDRCGFLTRKRYPGEAVYLVCGTTVFAGPLTTAEEIEEVSAEVSAQSRAGHELRMGLMEQWPKFRTVRVYDHTGRALGTEVR